MQVFNPSTNKVVTINENQIVRRDTITNATLMYTSFSGKLEPTIGEYHEPNEVAVMDTFFDYLYPGVLNLGIVGTPSFSAVDKTKFVANYKGVLPVAYSSTSNRFYLQVDVKNIGSENLPTGIGKIPTNPSPVDVVGNFEYVIYANGNASGSIKGTDVNTNQYVTVQNTRIIEEKKITNAKLSYTGVEYNSTNNLHDNDETTVMEFYLGTIARPSSESIMIKSHEAFISGDLYGDLIWVRTEVGDGKTLDVYVQFEVLNSGNPIGFNENTLIDFVGSLEYVRYLK